MCFFARAHTIFFVCRKSELRDWRPALIRLSNPLAVNKILISGLYNLHVHWFWLLTANPRALIFACLVPVTVITVDWVYNLRLTECDFLAGFVYVAGGSHWMSKLWFGADPRVWVSVYADVQWRTKSTVRISRCDKNNAKDGDKRRALNLICHVTWLCVRLIMLLMRIGHYNRKQQQQQ